jgi:Flp pilus assembly protein TadB
LFDKYPGDRTLLSSRFFGFVMTDFVTEIALLGAKIDANQAETNAKLDGIEKLMAANANHHNQIVAGLSGEITKVGLRVDDHDERLADLEADRREQAGAESERQTLRNWIVGLFTAAMGVIGGWWIAHAKF